MVKLGRIYTRGGDSGLSGLSGGVRRVKFDLRFQVIGAVDEANAALGVSRAVIASQDGGHQFIALLDNLQNDLFDVGAMLSTVGDRGETGGAKEESKRERARESKQSVKQQDYQQDKQQDKQSDTGERFLITAEKVAGLEREIDEQNKGLPVLQSFVLPGGSMAGAVLHNARATVRRAERKAWRLAESELVEKELLRYLNRLSDLLFVMARRANVAEGKELLWQIGGRR